MQTKEYRAISTYLRNGILPTTFESTQSNFVRKAKQFSLEKDTLLRQGLPVVKFSDRKLIFDEFHQHRGKDQGFLTGTISTN